jgi:3-keto-L-gulonate-6-phosphate decarboxylase
VDDSKTSDIHALLSRRDAVRLASGMAAAAALGAADAAWAQSPAANAAPPASARVVERLKARRSFQFSVDVATLDLGLTIAAAAVAGGIDIIEMGTPLLKTQGVANVVPAFRKRFPDALLLADMKSMDGAGGEARSVYSGGANIIDFLALAGVDSARAVCAVRDEFRRAEPAVPRLVFSDIIVPNTAVAQVGDTAMRMVEAGVDAVGIHLQVDARRANPKLIENDFLGEMAMVVQERIGKTTPVQVVGGLNIAQAQRLAKRGLPGFVISGNMGVADSETRYNLPAAEIQRLVRTFVTEVSAV